MVDAMDGGTNIHIWKYGCPSEPGEVFLRWSFRYFAALREGIFCGLYV
jgi:hypothetical protein